MRGHTDKNSTATYIQAVNKDGSIERVSLNLFNRGHFGWLYHHLIRLSMPNAPQLEVEQSTALIEQFRKELSPYQLEQLGQFLYASNKVNIHWLCNYRILLKQS
ncbi:hypothetical protein AWU65_25030 [Paenibacillus glucanolyticus]|uniref:Uncharacterized protein n=1 Tax=Paenibacillus glucanolyticus TaxID=59843 RepID=A0A163DQR7_9BACL|nr:hypothetical protein [Paenibacillus glucanolyticus]KZS43380.1 hypothetical protein AWU65_25030 [Paenibacillus glucanolyticus]